MYYTYILQCSDGSLYTGWTDDLDKRINAHNSGSGSKYTRSRRPVKMVYHEVLETKSDAMRREFEIKKLSRVEKLALTAKKSTDTVMRESVVKTVDAYIDRFPVDVQQKLCALRETIHAAVPDAAEKISYGMPTYFLQRNIVHFAAYKNHIGIYPGPRAIAAFHDELSGYQTSKGAWHIPLDQPLPLALLAQIVTFNAKEK